MAVMESELHFSLIEGKMNLFLTFLSSFAVEQR